VYCVRVSARVLCTCCINTKNCVCFVVWFNHSSVADLREIATTVKILCMIAHCARPVNPEEAKTSSTDEAGHHKTGGLRKYDPIPTTELIRTVGADRKIGDTTGSRWKTAGTPADRLLVAETQRETPREVVRPRGTRLART